MISRDFGVQSMQSKFQTIDPSRSDGMMGINAGEINAYR